RHVAGRVAGLFAHLCILFAGVRANAAPYWALRRCPGGATKGAGMIDSLATALGLGAQDPAFWMPLVLMLLLFVVIVAGTVLDGFDIGVACLALFAPAGLRLRMLALLSPWSDPNEFWLFLGMGLFAAAFPKAWGSIMGQL